MRSLILVSNQPPLFITEKAIEMAKKDFTVTRKEKSDFLKRVEKLHLNFADAFKELAAKTAGVPNAYDNAWCDAQFAAFMAKCDRVQLNVTPAPKSVKYGL